jgi:DNA mismatch endonuclease (patch repair protein)
MMSGIRSKDTRPEIAVRKLLHRMGYRFRLHRKDLPGRPDITLPRFRTIIFVNGCFWHGHENCPLFRPPKSREEFWRKKIATNKARDMVKNSELQELGWRTTTVWECSLKGRTALKEHELEEELRNAICSVGREYSIRGANKQTKED